MKHIAPRNIDLNNEIHDIVQFFLLNNEVIKSIGLSGKSALIHFFFSYANEFDKEHYADFAFELLQDNLKALYDGALENSSSRLDNIEFGWSLLQFAKKDFIEFDDLDEILYQFDKMAILETERMSREHLEFDIAQVFGLVLLASYLSDRIIHMENSANDFMEIKECMLICIFELANKISFLESNYTKLFTLIELLFKKLSFHNNSINDNFKTKKLIDTSYLESTMLKHGLSVKDKNIKHDLFLLLGILQKQHQISTNKNSMRINLISETKYEIKKFYNKYKKLKKNPPSKALAYAMGLFPNHFFENNLYMVYIILKLNLN